MIKVGDEIYSVLVNIKAVVQHIDAWNRYECFDENGSQFIIDTETFDDCWIKTGKNYPQIAQILKELKNKENKYEYTDMGYCTKSKRRWM